MAKDVTREYIPAATRKKIPDEDFAGPSRSFPVRNQSDVDNAARLIGHADDPEAVKAAIIRIAKRKGLSIPDAWQSGSDSKPKETATEASSPASFSPKSKVATFKTKFLSDGATSRNRRVYPQEAVDKLIQSGQLALETPGSDPLTCYISHGEADNDNSLKLAGIVRKVWKQGSDAWASIEMPDTTTGREAATLAKHGYLKTSLRATGAELKLSKSGGYPEVSGEGLRLMGIDFTTTPGIETVTVEDVTLESAQHPTPQDITEVLEMPADSLLLEELEETTEETTTEDAADGDGNNGAHSLVIANKSDIQEIHDRLANLQGRSCASSSMAQEAGRKLSQATMSELDKAHNKAAEVLGIECGSSSSSTMGDTPGSDGMQDGDDDDKQSAKPSTNEIIETTSETQEVENMTPEEMVQALKEAGFSIEPPKTEAEKLQEALNAKLAEQEVAFNAKLEEMANKMIASVTPKPQRQSLVEGATVTETSTQPKIYRKGSYLQEQLKGMDWAELADPTHPLPDGINVEYLLNEFGHMYLYKTGYYDVV